MSSARRGYLFGIAAYLCWGFFPLYWKLLRPMGALEILAHRIVWSVVLMVAIVTVGRGWRRIVALVRQPRRLGLIALAAIVIAINWTAYIYGVNADRGGAAALGHFHN